MEMRKENSADKKRRKIIIKSGPVLVRSVKPGQVESYTRENSNHTTSFWKY